jgi:hypothetical protein
MGNTQRGTTEKKVPKTNSPEAKAEALKKLDKAATNPKNIKEFFEKGTGENAYKIGLRSQTGARNGLQKAVGRVVDSIIVEYDVILGKDTIHKTHKLPYQID